MTQMIDISLWLAFPTVILSILVGVAVVYWLFVIVGALDIDAHGHGGDMDAGGHGGDAGDMDAGPAKGAEPGDGGGILDALGLRKVPITVTMSLLSFFAWILCALLMAYLGDIGGLPRWLMGIVVLLGSLLLATPPAAIVSRVVAPLFITHEGKRRAEYIGSACTITTGKVTADFGQAIIQDSGTSLLVQVRYDKGSVFARNDQALVIDYDEDRSAYLIEPMDAILGQKSRKS